jgi:hypothetical protein
LAFPYGVKIKMCLKTICRDCDEIFGTAQTECEYCEKETDEIYFCDTCREEVDIDDLIEYTVGIECYDACPSCYKNRRMKL